MTTIAFLGAGNMGRGMIRNLLRAGYGVRVFNRTPEKARVLEADGATVATTPRAAVDGAEVIIAMLTDNAASRDCWTGHDGALAGAAQGALAIECSSLSRDWVVALAGEAGRRGLRFLDCPVAGRPDVAAAGRLSIFAGGAAEDVAAARPVLMSLGDRLTHFGPAGSGIAFKLIYNLLGATQIAALGEAMLACEAAGIDPGAAAEAISTGSTGSPHVVRHAAAMARRSGPQPVAFSGAARLKDIGYGLALAESVNAQAKIGQATRVVFAQMAALGMAERNDSELIDALRLGRE